MSEADARPVKTRRTKERIRAMEVLYEARIKDLDNPVGIRELVEQRSQQMVAQTPLSEYAKEILEGVAEHLDRIDSALTNYSEGRSLKRFNQVDLATLRVGVWEILYNDEVDRATAIDEASKIVKERSTDASVDFIGGVLNRIADLSDTLK